MSFSKCTCFYSQKHLPNGACYSLASVQGLGEGTAAVLSRGKVYLLRPEGAAAETEKY